MRAIPNLDRSRLIAAAMQRIPCDLTIQNIQLVNVITGEQYPAEVDVLDGVIIRVREEGEDTQTPSREIYDGCGRYLMPGFIDIHMHVESTMLTPEEFGNAAIRCGTTAVFVDPHEIANVMGIPGIDYMLENAKRSPVRQYNLAPSCVPSVPGLEGSGAEFGPKEIELILEKDGVVGVAEVMDCLGVAKDTPRMHGILEAGLRKDALIQGHAPRVYGKELAAYILGGPTDNHSGRTARECCENLRAGLHVNLQASSLSSGSLPEMLEGLKKHRYHDNVSLCTDDVHAKDLLETGQINRIMKRLIALGVDPMDAIRWGTYNPAREAGLSDLGAIAPGYAADLQLVDALDGRNPFAVFVGGKLMCEGGTLLHKAPSKESISFPNTVHLSYITGPKDFCLIPPDESSKVCIVPCNEAGRALNEPLYEHLPLANGSVDLTDRESLCFLSVCNRHGARDKTVCVFKNFGLLRGAVASTVSHDSHNFTVAYKNPKDAYVSARYLRDAGGGMCVVLDGEVLAALPLPVAGLMSPLSCGDLVQQIEQLETAVGTVCESRKMMMRIAISSLLAAPILCISDRGLVDGRTQTFVDLFQSV
ncbi:adenine deaminase C-terminal domain-containing protein [Enterocloster citroniae]|uniref:adenine deaminase n=1 Tax=Enterocloster citroniae TaxID=358743 RepID=UPI0032C10171